MTASRPAPSARPYVAAALGVVAVAALLLPWWRAAVSPVLLAVGPSQGLDADTWPGWEVAGVPLAALQCVVAVAALAATLRKTDTLAHGLTAAAGAGAAALGISALVKWGVSGAAGPWVTIVAGAGAFLLASSPWFAVPMLVAIALSIVFLDGPPQPDASGPFVRIAGLDAAGLRSGTPELPRPLDGRLITVDGAAAVVTEDGIARLDTRGRAEVLARVPDHDRGRPGGVLGVAGDRVARWVDVNRVAVTGLRAGDPVAIVIRDISAAGPVGADGMLWLRAIGDPMGTVRRLDLRAYQGEQSLAAVYLPVVTIDLPAGAEPLDPSRLLPAADGALRFVAQESGYRLERVTPDSSGVAITTLAGGLDPTCGLSRAPRDAHIPSSGPLAIDAAGGVWYAGAPDRLARLGADGVLQAVPQPLPGPVIGLVAAADGSIVAAVAGQGGPGLWRLPDAAGALADLPPTPPGCLPAPPRVGPPVELVPIGTTDASGVPLDTTGRWAATRRDRLDVAAVGVDGSRAALGTRRDGKAGRVWPDGSGGVWWLEAADPGAVTLVHGRTGIPEERLGPLRVPASTLIPDLGGRPPLLGAPTGVYRVDGSQVLQGAVSGGVVRADGRGWVLVDGRLVTLEGTRVIDAGEGRGGQVPVAVQLAQGVAPAQLALPRATVGLDARGGAVVVTDGVVLAVADDGAVSVAAQDARLHAPFTVVGGLVEVADGTLLRVDLPR